MRVAVLFFGGGKREKTADIARGVAAGLEKSGHHVDVIDGDRDVNAKLTMYEYLVIGTATVSTFRGRIDSRIPKYLSGAGMVGGKKCFTFIVDSLFGSQRGLRNLMAAVEHEGVFIRFSEVLRSREEAEVLADRLKL
jgi:menaquinone-dependent protoporphyrinogen IX oxidase